MLKHKILFFLILISQILLAQNMKKCNTTFLVNQEMQLNKEYLENRKRIISENKIWINQNKNSNKNAAVTIPIVVHVIYRSNHVNIGSGTNISDERILDAIRVLNEDYSKTNPEFPNPLAVGGRNTFLNYAGNPNIQFCLATIDPNGNSTTGITRTMSSKTNFDPTTEANDMKQSSTGGTNGWDPSKYLNIWICDLAVSSSGGMTLGYAYLPGLPPWQNWKDGLVVDFQWFGTIEGAQGDSRTATHEIGHYLGLNHTFCESQSGGCCDNDNNNVDDTPLCYNINNNGPYFGPVTSSTYNNTCNDIGQGFSSDLLDMDENFMAYSQNTWMFTNSQVDAMNATLFGSSWGNRSSLINSNVTSNCSGTLNLNNLLNNNQIRIYPNPTKEIITVENLMQINNKSIIIKNILGEIILVDNTKSNLVSLNLSHLKSGIYFIEVSSFNGVRFEKIILSK
tara:strand:- start:904 stop:2259 length:1356 start_codon:yes stop_codon:yes gene_type:complete